MTGKPRAFVYVDAFNLYYGALQNTAYRWLNLETLFDRLLPDFDVEKIYYFTARLREKANPRDSEAPLRQKAYLLALGTLDRVKPIYGNFMVHASRAPRRRKRRIFGFQMPSTWSFGKSVDIWKIEEKGSDVSLGSRLALDAATMQADLYLVVTSDSDLAPTVDMILQETDARLAYCPPHHSQSKRLSRCGFEFTVRISPGALRNSQFPEVVQLRKSGEAISQPERWKK